MSKKNLMITLVIFSLPASFVCFYATNLILSDVANMFYMTLTQDVISSIPIFLIAVEFVMAAINILQFGLYPTERKRLLRLNAAAIAVLSAVGAVCAVLTGTIIYGSFTAPYPFPGATILSLLFHLAVLVLALLVVRRCRKPEPSDKSVFFRIGRAVQWLLLAVFVYYAFDRFGAVLWMPTYVQLTTLYKTIFFYLSLLLPVCLLLHHCRYRLHLYRNRKLACILYPLIYLAADLCLCAAVMTYGIHDTQFVAAISPALGIERLLGEPVITRVHFILVTLLILASLAYTACKLIFRARKRQSPEGAMQ